MSSDPTGILAMVAKLQATYEAQREARGLTPEEFDAEILTEETRQLEERRKQLERETRRAIADQHGSRMPDEARLAFLAGRLALTPSLDAVSRWLDGSRTPVLILVGGVGAGKTLAALEALVRVPGDMVHARELARRYDPWGDDRNGNVRPLDLRHRLIVLDDLGTERADPRFQPALEDLVDFRQGNGLRTLITTNVSAGDIRRLYGDRVADRLNAIAKAVRLDTDSMRRRPA